MKPWKPGTFSIINIVWQMLMFGWFIFLILLGCSLIWVGLYFFQLIVKAISVGV